MTNVNGEFPEKTFELALLSEVWRFENSEIQRGPRGD